MARASALKWTPQATCHQVIDIVRSLGLLKVHEELCLKAEAALRDRRGQAQGKTKATPGNYTKCLPQVLQRSCLGTVDDLSLHDTLVRKT